MTITDNARVTLDHDTSFPAHDNGQRWNGWVCPTFSRETAAAIVEWNAEDRAAHPNPDSDVLSWDGDTVLIDSPVYHDEQGYAPERITPDAHGRYAIGAWAWVWSRVEQVPCHECGNPDTIPADPNRPEEQGHYCERCGRVTADDGVHGLL